MALLADTTYNITTKRKSVISPVKLPVGSHEDFLSFLLGEQDNTDSLSAQKRNVTNAQAVSLSQSFPVFSTSNTVKRERKNQYYDGGVYDNSGLSTVRDIYNVLSKVRDEVKPCKKIVILYLRNSLEKSEYDECYEKCMERRDKIELENVTSEINSRCKECCINKDISFNSMNTLVKAISGSIFDANPVRQIEKLNILTKSFGDTLFLDELSYKGNEEVSLNRWVSDNNADTLWSAISNNLKDVHYTLFNHNPRKIEPLSHELNVFFEFNKSHIDKEVEDSLKNYFTRINPSKLILTGFTDWVGGESDKNKKLAKDRVTAVENILKGMKLKVEHKDFNIIGEGSNNVISVR